MKILKYLFIIVVSIVVVIFLAIYLYKGVVVNNLADKNKLVKTKWTELYNFSNNRLKVLATLVDNNEKNQLLDSLRIELQNNEEKHKLYKEECLLDFVKLEYDLNKVYVNVLKKYSNDSILKQSSQFKILVKLKEIDLKANALIEQYNDAVSDNNRYISIFPNFYFAKSDGFDKKKYFSIKYGVENEDPIIKSKELPAWAKDKDTL